MVGVPGRSKACRTCKRRKKACDGHAPSCGQCVRNGISCGGYDKARIFINTSQKHGDAKTHRFTPESYAPLALTKSRTHTALAESTTTSTPSRPSEIEQVLSRMTLQLQCFDNFWSSLLPNGRTFSDQAIQYSTAGWLGKVQDFCQRDGLVRLTVFANALGMLGEQSGQRSMILEGWRTYGMALQALARSLPAAGHRKCDELLMASQLLGQYELLQGARDRCSTSASGIRWLQHTYGTHAIVLAKRPEYYAKGLAHRLFTDARLHLIYPNLRDRKRCVFSSPEWKSIPWSLHPKDPKNELVDILIEIPGIMEELDELLGSPPDQAGRQMYLSPPLEEKSLLLDSQLQQWSITSGVSTVNFVESQISSDDQEISTPSTEDFAMAHLGMLYWTTCLFLYQILYCHLSNYSLRELPDRMEPRRYCRKIMLLMPYFQRPNVGEFFMNIAILPAIAATRFLDRNDPPDQPSYERKMIGYAFRGKYKRQMEHFLGTWPRRTPWCQRDLDGSEVTRNRSWSKPTHSHV